VNAIKNLQFVFFKEIFKHVQKYQKSDVSSIEMFKFVATRSIKPLEKKKKKKERKRQEEDEKERKRGEREQAKKKMHVHVISMKQSRVLLSLRADS
jgi:hypothetical protein